jgi:hypothetical protein
MFAKKATSEIFLPIFETQRSEDGELKFPKHVTI